MATLEKFGVPFEAHVYSAHRTPEEARAFALGAREKGFGAVIAAAGKAAHLAGAMAASTTLPVIGIPIKSSTLDGQLLRDWLCGKYKTYFLYFSSSCRFFSSTLAAASALAAFSFSASAASSTARICLNHRNRQKAGRREVFKQPLIQGIKNTEDYKSKWKNYAERCENEQTS